MREDEIKAIVKVIVESVTRVMLKRMECSEDSNDLNGMDIMNRAVELVRWHNVPVEKAIELFVLIELKALKIRQIMGEPFKEGNFGIYNFRLEQAIEQAQEEIKKIQKMLNGPGNPNKCELEPLLEKVLETLENALKDPEYKDPEDLPEDK